MPRKQSTSKNKSGSRDKTVEKYMAIFNFAYKKSKSDFTRLKSLQQSYDNTILDSVWPTHSKLPIASFYDMVEKALPTALDMLFPPTNQIQLMPLEQGVTMDQVRTTESALWNLVSRRMKIKRNSLAIIKDCFKCSVGFGIVEPFSVSLPSSFKLSVTGKSKTAKRRSTRVMEIGAPQTSLRLRYVSPGQIVVMLDGSDFNGNNPVSISFLYDIYSEGQFRDMYKAEVQDGEQKQLLGNVDEIVGEARTGQFTSDTDIDSFFKSMGGKNLKTLQPDSEHVPTHIPVLKVFDQHTHVWIANGTTKIYERSDEYQNLRCPLIKASAWVDGHRFYPMSTPEAFQRIAWGKNIVVNLFIDILSLMTKRPLVYNSEYFDRDPTFGPDSRIRTSAPDARMGAAFLEYPRMDASSMTVYEMINTLGASLTGQKDFMDKNYTRGGGMAFQDLLVTSEGIERIKNSILEMTFLESVIQQALIYMQTSIGAEGERYWIREQTKSTDGKIKDEIHEITVTEDDVCHGYELSLDMGVKRRKGAMEQAISLQIYDRKSKSPFFDQYEVAADHLCSSDEEIRREMRSREEVAKIQNEKAQLEQEEQASRVISNLRGGGGAMPSGSPEGVPAEGASAEAGAILPEGM